MRMLRRFRFRAMLTVMEKMQQGASQQQQKWQYAQGMRLMLGQQKKTDDSEKSQQHPVGTVHDECLN